MRRTASLYIHIPFCEARCAYCDFFSTVRQDSSLFTPYIKALIKDISFFRQKYEIEVFNTVYIGGGTPSLLPPKLLCDLSAYIQKEQMQKISEFTIEANPQDITKEKLASWQSSGINRLSIGIQSFNDEVLEAEKRRGSRVESLNALNLVKEEWKGIVSLDFIAGLKKQTKLSLIEDLKIATSFCFQHISLYEFVSHGGCEDEPLKEIIWEAGANFLEESNYRRYEISNFSYEGKFECLHNMAYWQLLDYVGVGSGACGNVKIRERGEIFATRFTGVYDVASYIKEEDRSVAYTFEEIEKKDLIKDAILMGMRLSRGIDLSYFKFTFGLELTSLLPLTIERWQKMELLVVKGDFLFLTKRGLLFLNTFLRDVFKEMELF